MPADGDGSDPFHGKIENRDGCLKMYSMVRATEEGKWVSITNFTMVPRYHSINRVEGEGTFFIFDCHIQGSDDSFLVPFTHADLGKNSSVYKIINNHKRKHGGYNDEERRNKAKLNRFLVVMIKRYEASNNKTPAIVMNTTGRISLQLSDHTGQFRTVEAYVLGPSCVLPVNPLEGLLIEVVKKVWVGPDVDNFALPSRIGNDPKGYLDAVMAYHAVNKMSPLAALTYSWLSMNKQALQARGMKLGVCHVVGKMSVGKTIMRQQLAYVMPRILTPEGLVVKDEEMLSVHKLLEKFVESRHPIIQDPPNTDMTQMDRMNTFLDLTYENKVELSAATKATTERRTPSCGAIFVWPNEFEKLTEKKMSHTSISKGLFLLQVHNDKDHVEKLTQLEKAWRDKIDSAPALFLYLLAKVDFDELQGKSEEIASRYHQELQGRYPELILNIGQRLIKQYAMIQAAATMWFSQPGIEMTINEDMEMYFLKVCIPFVFKLLQEKKTVRAAPPTTPPEERLVEAIGKFTEHEFLCNVGIFYIQKEAHYGFPLAFARSKSDEMIDFLKSMMTERRRDITLHPSSKELWFKRCPKGNIYGLHRKVQMHVCPVSKLPQSVKTAIKDKLQSILPDCDDIDIEGNVKKLMQDAFDSIHLPQAGKLQQVLDTVKKLDGKETELVLQYAESLIQKRVQDDPNADNNSSPNEDDVASGSETDDKVEEITGSASEEEDNSQGQAGNNTDRTPMKKRLRTAGKKVNQP